MQSLNHIGNFYFKAQTKDKISFKVLVMKAHVFWDLATEQSDNVIYYGGFVPCDIISDVCVNWRLTVNLASGQGRLLKVSHMRADLWIPKAQVNFPR